ncbi:MAG: hypothetical protein KAY24_07310 [Candidatus Eisenbacteria sp.]|nr:hypothetical protein [Candidatus Eisenbacteria bacterium]
MMKTSMRILWLQIAFLTLAPIAIGHDSGDPVFEAMELELDRSMDQLVLGGMSQPYFLGYRIQDSQMVMVEARYGALVQAESNRNRYLYIDLKVGAPNFDNSGFIGNWSDVYNMREELPVEDDIRSLRHHIWLHTDHAYKTALENMARKQAYLQTHPAKEEIPDFAAANGFVHMDEPVGLDVDLGLCESRVRAAAQALREFPGLQDWNVRYTHGAANNRYLNSEGICYLKGIQFQYLLVAATAQAPDGQRLSHFLQYALSSDDELPAQEVLIEDIRTMAGELQAMIAAPTLDEYAGPVLFDGFAAAQLLSQLFVNQLSPAREPLVAEDWMKQYLPDPKLTGRLNRRVLADFVVITDEPSLKKWEGRSCAGHQKVDDEGVRCQDITLVKGGRLLALPMTRRPSKKLKESNGHARMLPNQMIVPGITNLVLRGEQTKKDLRNELRRLCKEFGNEYGLLITRLEDPEVTQRYRRIEPGREEQDLLTAPVVMYRIYAEDGRMEPVRGLGFDEASVRALRDVAAVGQDAKGTNLRQPSGFRGLSYPATIITPSILIEEMEFTDAIVREPLPLSGIPIIEQ